MCAGEPGTCVILAGKRDSRRHSTTSFFENVAVVFFLSFYILWSGEGSTSFKEYNRVLFYGEKKVKVIMNTRENFKLNLVLESKVSSPVLATGFY